MAATSCLSMFRQHFWALVVPQRGQGLGALPRVLGELCGSPRDNLLSSHGGGLLVPFDAWRYRLDLSLLARTESFGLSVHR
jgi:hypothetical protein